LTLARAALIASLLAQAAVSACQYHGKPPSGQQRCASQGSMLCPAGYECRADQKCYVVGDPSEAGAMDQRPAPDAGRDTDSDTGPPATAEVGRSSHRTVAGSTVSGSPRYRLHMTTGAGVPSGRVSESNRYRLVGGT